MSATQTAGNIVHTLILSWKNKSTWSLAIAEPIGMQAPVPAFIVKIAVAGGSGDGKSLQAKSSPKKNTTAKIGK